MSPEQEQFLKSIRAFAAKFAGISLGDVSKRFNLPFWTYEQIQGSLQQRKEWDVSANFIPFYGDWHDLICLDIALGQVVFLDDSGKVVFAWPSTEGFLASFVVSLDDVADSAQSGPRLVKMQLSKELQQKLRARIRNRKD